MYGLVNRAIRELIIDGHGEKLWSEIAFAAGVDAGGFTDFENYDDEISYSLISSASKHLETPPEDILHAFGKYWVLYVGSAEWGHLFDVAGNDFLTFLQGLDDLHARVESSMPESRLPQFTLLEGDGQYELEYRSHRPGFAPMITGLLEGLSEHFGESWAFAHVGYRGEDGFDTFSLTRMEAHKDVQAA